METIADKKETRKHDPSDELNFKNNNPGSVLYGNFINYYKFNPPDQRTSLLPEETDVWHTALQEDACCVLDVGCNAGDLTIAIQKFLTTKIGIQNCTTLGVDIDPILIERAIEKNNEETNNVVEFVCVNIMDHEKWTKTYLEYLKKYQKDKFSIAFCFSVTMWIHLNHGDEGLKKFLKLVSQISKILVIEPQPWKCYLTAKKRHKDFPEFKNIKIRQNVEMDIDNILENHCGCVKIKETDRTKWGRKLMFFKCKNIVES